MKLLVIDACLTHRMATELRRRGRDSKSLADLGIGGKDPEILRALRDECPHAVLVTDDDRMPLAHADVIEETQTTIAIIPSLEASAATWQVVDPDHKVSECHKWEVIQRWAHRMASQESDTRKRYSLNGTGKWTPRVRPVRFAQTRLKVPR